MNRDLVIAAIFIGVLIYLATGYYQNVSKESFPGENKYRLAGRYLEDGKLEEALPLFDEALALRSEYKDAHLGKAITLMELERMEEAREMFDRAIELDEDFAEAYANRGVLNDRTGHYEAAIDDYRTALRLKPKLAKGPGRLWKFMHNVSGKIPTFADRADYLEAELAKPEEERVLRIPQVDAQQRMYKK